jgi:hypothetical protein
VLDSPDESVTFDKTMNGKDKPSVEPGPRLSWKLIAVIAVIAVALSLGFRRWREQKQLERSGGGSTNVIINDGFKPEGTGTIQR